MVVINALIPVFGLILLGYLLGWRRWVPTQAGDSLSSVTFKLFMPVLLFSGLAKADLGQAMSPLLVLVYFVPALTVFVGINLLMHRRAGRPTSMGLAASFSNNVLVGIPVVTLVLGQEFLVYLFAILVFHSLVLFTAQSLYAAFWAEGDRKAFDLRAVLRNFANPLIIGLLLGALLNMSGLQVPAPLWRAVEWLASAALPCALLVLGLSLSHYRLHMSVSMGVLTLSKLVLLPVLVLLGGLLIPGLDPQARTVLVIMAACPTGVNVLAFYMGPEDNRIISSVVFLSTLLSAITLPLWLLLVG